MAAAVERFWASRELRRASYSFRVRAGSAPHLGSQRGWSRRSSPGRQPSPAAEGAAARARQSSILAHAGRQWCVHVRSLPPRRGKRPTLFGPACRGRGYPRRGLGVVGEGGVREWRRGRLAVVGKRGPIRGCGQFQGRSWRGYR